MTFIAEPGMIYCYILGDDWLAFIFYDDVEYLYHAVNNHCMLYDGNILTCEEQVIIR